MRILGIDPGNRGYHWATYDKVRNEIIAWGDESKLPNGAEFDAVAIEDIAAIYHPSRTRTDTAKMIGRLQAAFPDAIMITRERVRTVLTGSARGSEAAANRALNRFIPSFAARRRGLNGHHRAAAACAFVAVGRLQRQKIEGEKR